MISKIQIKNIVALHQGKFRKELKQFIVEGPKVVRELLDSSFSVDAIYATSAWNETDKEKAYSKKISVTEISSEELKKISVLSTPNQVLAVAQMEVTMLDWGMMSRELTLMLDAIRDPGNLGTIIRIADWFGIGQIICSKDCVEMHNPKVIQAAMGSAFRVKVFYQDLNSFLEDIPDDIPVYGAFLEGTNLSEIDLQPRGIVVIGSESHGISSVLQPYITEKLFIPSFLSGSLGSGLAESLNASVAASIILYEFRRPETGNKLNNLDCSCKHPKN